MESDPNTDMPPTPRLFNDVYFGRPHPALFETWSPFSRLPVDIRLQIWLTVLRRHRMLEITIQPAHDIEDEYIYPGGAGSWFYTECNHLGNIVSGRGYTLEIAGRGYAATFSPILWVNRESRDAALRYYYRVHLPFPHQHAGQILYLNPEHDVLYLSPESAWRQPPDHLPEWESWPLTILADFLHDVKAFDPKDQGVMHIALSKIYIGELVELATRSGRPPMTPASLHPLAAASFADILRSRLRSVLCRTGFRHNRRGMGEFTVERYHFAQTFPLCRRGNSTGTFLWLKSDPRPGLEFDLRQVRPEHQIPPLVKAWQALEKAFGIEERSPDDRFRMYVCPSLDWPTRRDWSQPHWEDLPAEKWRTALALHLRQEADAWDGTRGDLDFWIRSLRYRSLPILAMPTPTPRHGTQVDAETFEMMERTPCTAIALWLFPIEVFSDPVSAGRNNFDLSANSPPGLFLFEV